MKTHKDRQIRVYWGESSRMWHCTVWYSKIFLIQHPWDQRGAGLSGSNSTDPNSYRYLFVTVRILEALVLRDFAATRPENLHHFSTLKNNFWIWDRQSMAALVVQEVTSLSHCQPQEWLTVWQWHDKLMIMTRQMWFSLQQHWFFLLKWLRHINLHHLVLSTSKIGKWQSVIIEEKVDATSWLEQVRIVDIAVMLRSLILVYIQYVIMLTELQKVLSQELKRLDSKKNMAIPSWTWVGP